MRGRGRRRARRPLAALRRHGRAGRGRRVAALGPRAPGGRARGAGCQRIARGVVVDCVAVDAAAAPPEPDQISPLEWSSTRIDVVEPDGDASQCAARAEDLAATFDAYTAAETPWRLAAALDTAGPRPADPVDFAVWCAAARPPAAAGSGFDVRPSLLEALDGVSRLVIAEHGLRRALAERQGDDVTAFGEPPRLPAYVRADLSS